MVGRMWWQCLQYLQDLSGCRPFNISLFNIKGIDAAILGILYVFVHLTPYNALFSVHLLTARHQFIWPSPLIYNRLLNKTHFSLRSMQALRYPSGFYHLLWRRHLRGYITGVIRKGQTTIGLSKAVLMSLRGVILTSLRRNTAT